MRNTKINKKMMILATLGLLPSSQTYAEIRRIYYQSPNEHGSEVSKSPIINRKKFIKFSAKLYCSLLLAIKMLCECEGTEVTLG